MNTGRAVYIWNHHCEGIKRNKGSSHLVEACLHTSCFFPGTALVFFLLYTQTAEDQWKFCPTPHLTGKRRMRIFQEEYSSLSWKDGDGGKEEKSHLCVSTCYHSRTKNSPGLYISDTHFTTSFKLPKSIVSISESLSNPSSLFYLQSHFHILVAHHFLPLLLSNSLNWGFCCFSPL